MGKWGSEWGGTGGEREGCGGGNCEWKYLEFRDLGGYIESR